VATRTLAKYGGGTLVVSGHQGEAERLAALARNDEVIVERTARTTWENVERTIPGSTRAERVSTCNSYDLTSQGASSLPSDSGGADGGFKSAEPHTRQHWLRDAPFEPSDRCRFRGGTRANRVSGQEVGLFPFGRGCNR
jgi:hypothetical protein